MTRVDRLRMVPIHRRLKDAGAVFAASYGLETPSWFAREGEAPRDDYGYGRANWFAAVGEECRATREAVGLYEISGFAKYRVRGPGAEAWLDQLLAGRVPRENLAHGAQPDAFQQGPPAWRLHGQPVWR